MSALLSVVVCLALMFGVIKACRNTDSYKAEQAEEARQAAADAKPHVIREADGCKVYAFKAGERFHYFTRCPDAKTSTDTNYEVCTQSGKTRTCKPQTETIEVNK